MHSQVYMCGCLLYELLFGLPPFEKETTEELEREIVKGASIPIYARVSEPAQARPTPRGFERAEHWIWPIRELDVPDWGANNASSPLTASLHITAVPPPATCTYKHAVASRSLLHP